jgi:hypothetical protein
LRVLDNQVARTTIGNQIRQLIRLFVTLSPKVAKSCDVMNMQFTSDFPFGDATALARIAISLARFAALFVPIGTVIVFVPATPRGIISASQNGEGSFGHVQCLPIGFALPTAKLTFAFTLPCEGNLKRFSALFANTVGSTVRRMIRPNDVFRLPFATTCTRTKMLFGFADFK